MFFLGFSPPFRLGLLDFCLSCSLPPPPSLPPLALPALFPPSPPGPPALRAAARELARQEGVEAQEDGGVWAPGRPLLDPYAPLVAGRDVWGEWGQAEGPAPGGAGGSGAGGRRPAPRERAAG